MLQPYVVSTTGNFERLEKSSSPKTATTVHVSTLAEQPVWPRLVMKLPVLISSYLWGPAVVSVLEVRNNSNYILETKYINSLSQTEMHEQAMTPTG
ncbi:hypothetical protein BsWGS_19026 [Bradybaena similaris]